ncbi:MAG: hypothetical protein ACE366_15105 [Bradymonadia bacterium]
MHIKLLLLGMLTCGCTPERVTPPNADASVEALFTSALRHQPDYTIEHYACDLRGCGNHIAHELVADLLWAASHTRRELDDAWALLHTYDGARCAPGVLQAIAFSGDLSDIERTRAFMALIKARGERSYRFVHTPAVQALGVIAGRFVDIAPDVNARITDDLITCTRDDHWLAQPEFAQHTSARSSGALINNSLTEPCISALAYTRNARAHEVLREISREADDVRSFTAQRALRLVKFIDDNEALVLEHLGSREQSAVEDRGQP